MTIATLSLEERLDQITTKLDVVVDELERTRFERDRWRDLATDATPLARQALEGLGTSLEDAELSLDDLRGLAESFLVAVPVLEGMLRQLSAYGELVETARPLVDIGVASTSRLMQDMDDRGYVEFVRAGAGVVDRVVTSFDRADIEALGDNVVLILQTIREMTQPEVMTMLRRTVSSVSEDEVAEPPGAFRLLGQLRDPEVRRGLNKIMHTLKSIGAQAPEQRR